MKLEGSDLIAALSTTTHLVKLLSDDGKPVGQLTASQALKIVQADAKFIGGGSPNRVRYIRRPEQQMTAMQKQFAKTHELPRYDPTYFRNFVGIQAPSSTAQARRKGTKK